MELWPQSTVGEPASLKNPTTAGPCRAALQPAGRAAEDTLVTLMGELEDVNLERACEGFGSTPLKNAQCSLYCSCGMPRPERANGRSLLGEERQPGRAPGQNEEKKEEEMRHRPPGTPLAR